ncbi:MAG: DUF4411 family protein [Candidatus Omnitrophica bacterium]|nr:DUF4411 family protein [Candidatus Omnitrophota bacterium]
MPTDKKYLLDANVFMEAKRRYYAFDICPGYWDCLVAHHQEDRVLSLDRVKQELERGGDDLWEWAESVMPGACFASSDDPSVTAEFAQILAWVQGQAQFFPEAKAEFAGNTDGWLVAYAKAKSLVLVTQEVFSRDARRKVPIPNVCEAFGVTYVNTFEMLRELETQFSWQPGT